MSGGIGPTRVDQAQNQQQARRYFQQGSKRGEMARFVHSRDLGTRAGLLPYRLRNAGFWDRHWHEDLGDG